MESKIDLFAAKADGCDRLFGCDVTHDVKERKNE
jgi:hypothetical protein